MTQNRKDELPEEVFVFKRDNHLHTMSANMDFSEWKGATRYIRADLHSAATQQPEEVSVDYLDALTLENEVHHPTDIFKWISEMYPNGIRIVPTTTKENEG